MSLKDVSNEETPPNLTPKSVEEMVEEVLEGNMIAKMFQAMAIASMKLGNLGLKVLSLKTILTTMEGGK